MRAVIAVGIALFLAIVALLWPAIDHSLPDVLAAGSGLSLSKNANPSAPTGGNIVVQVSASATVTITSILDHYEVHYQGNNRPSGCNLPAGTSGNGWYQLVGTVNGVNLNQYAIHFSGSPTLNDATPNGASQNVALASGSSTTWSYSTSGQIVIPSVCVSGNMNTMLNYISITTNTGDVQARSVSYPPSAFVALATATPTNTPTATATPTPTGVAATATATPTNTATSTSVPATAVPAATLTPTSVLATAVPTAAATPTSTATSTTVPATAVPTATATPTSTATSTTVPATAVPTPTSTPTAAAATATPTSGGIVTDGQFNDWIGGMNISDKSGDCTDGTLGHDAHYLYWGVNSNDSTLYFMIERYTDAGTAAGQDVTYKIYVDTNNNGQYTDDGDRLIQVYYQPRQNNSNVAITVTKPNGTQIDSYNGDWGQSIREGALKAELGAPFADLGMQFNQTIRFYAASQCDRIPDQGDVQYSPIPILDYPLLALLMAGGIAFVWWQKGRFMWRTPA